MNLNYLGESVSNAVGLQAALCKKDVLYPFIDKFRTVLLDHADCLLRDSRLHVRWDGSGNVC